MIGNPFQSRLISFKTINVNTQGRKELKLLFESAEAVQDFLESWDESFNMNMRHYFKTDIIHWNNIEFKDLFPHLNIRFDCATGDGVLLEKCEVNKIKVKRKDTKQGAVFNYELTIVKPVQSRVDELLSDVYYQTKDYDENDKLQFIWYETEIERTI